MSCGVGCRSGSDPALLWLWRRPVATVPIQPLAWESPYATGTALKIHKQTHKNVERRNILSLFLLCALPPSQAACAGECIFPFSFLSNDELAWSAPLRFGPRNPPFLHSHGYTGKPEVLGNTCGEMNPSGWGRTHRATGMIRGLHHRN